MSYATINRCANDEPFRGRVTAAIAAEGEPNPYTLLSALVWPISARPMWRPPTRRRS